MDSQVSTEQPRPAHLVAVHCTLCGSDHSREVASVRDYRFGEQGEYRYVECAGCGVVYQNPQPNLDTVFELYRRDYTPDGAPATDPHPQSDAGLVRRAWYWWTGHYLGELVERSSGTVLDIGCGDGEILLQLRQRGLDTFGVECNTCYESVHKTLGLEVHYGTLEEAGFPDARFDTVILSQVIEHLTDPLGTLREIHRILKPQGRLLVYCPNARGYLRRVFGKYWHGWHAPFHYFVFSTNDLERLAADAGFRVSSSKTSTPNEFFVTSLKSRLFRNSEKARPMDRGGWLDNRLVRAALGPCLRILDLVQPGRGDCIRLELVKD